MANFLIIYASSDGHTRKIAERIGAILATGGHALALMPIEEASGVDLQAFDRIVIGASIRYGRHSPRLLRFIEARGAALARMPGALFSVNIVARKPEKNRPETNPYLRKLLRRIAWRPAEVAVFAGKLDYARYRPLDRLMIRCIMRMTGGPTDPHTAIEFTDWSQVEAFARRIGELPPPPPAGA